MIDIPPAEEPRRLRGSTPFFTLRQFSIPRVARLLHGTTFLLISLDDRSSLPKAQQEKLSMGLKAPSSFQLVPPLEPTVFES